MRHQPPNKSAASAAPLCNRTVLGNLNATIGAGASSTVQITGLAKFPYGMFIVMSAVPHPPTRRREGSSLRLHAVPSGNCAPARRRSRQAMAERERCHFAAVTTPPGRCSLRSVRNNRE